MPLFMTLNHGQTIVVKGDSIRWSELRRKTVRAVSMGGHAVAIRREAISLIEAVPEDQYRTMVEEAKKRKEEQGSGQRIATPRFAVPQKRN